MTEASRNSDGEVRGTKGDGSCAAATAKTLSWAI